MDTSWLSNTSSGVFNYLYKHITGEDDSARPSSSLDVLSKANVWITDLPTNNYEPLEASHGARRPAKKVGVSFSFTSILLNFSDFASFCEGKYSFLPRISMLPLEILKHEFVALGSV